MMKARPQRAQKQKPKAQQKDPKGSGKQLQSRDPWQRDMFAMANAGKAVKEKEIGRRVFGKSPTGIKTTEEAPSLASAFSKTGQHDPKAAISAQKEAPTGKDKTPVAEGKKVKENVKPEIGYETLLSARSGGKLRTTVGVGEEVKFTGNAVGDWKASVGKPRKKPNSQEFLWKAPKRADTVSITFMVGKELATISITVVEPEEIVTSIKQTIPYAKGQAAVGMDLYFDYRPFSVSFGNVEAGEKSGPATGITGYYKETYSKKDLRHDSGDHFTRIQENNRDSIPDQAHNNGDPPPWSIGEFHWVIPNRFRVAGENGNGKVFTNVTQSFFIDAAGTTTVKKGVSSVTRKVNDG